MRSNFDVDEIFGMFHLDPHLIFVDVLQSPDNDIGKNSYAIQKVRFIT